MSTSTPVPLPLFCAGTQDTRGLNVAPSLNDPTLPAPDSVASITGITVSRLDGQTIGSNDLSITPEGKPAPWISASAPPFSYPGMQINWWQTAGASIAANGPVTYLLAVAFVTAAGRELTYTAQQVVSATLG